MRQTTVFALLLVLAWGCQSPSSSSSDKAKPESKSAISVYLGSTTGTLVGEDPVTVNAAVLGTPSTTTFTIVNTGEGKLTLSAPALSGADAARFSISEQPALSVAAGETTTFELTFNPDAEGAAAAKIKIANNSKTSPSFEFDITANATAVAEPAISLAVGSSAVAAGGTVSFGNVDPGLNGDVTFTLTNNGTAALVLDAVTVSEGSYSLLSGPESLTVAVGSSQTFQVRFSPATPGTKTGTLTLDSNIDDFTVNLTGEGTVLITAITVTGAGANSIATAGGTLQLTAATTPSDASVKTMTWTSDTPSIATVSSSGLVTAGSTTGFATITATAQDGTGITGTMKVYVELPGNIWVVKQPLADTTDTTTVTASGTSLLVHNNYSATGNAFVYAAGPPATFFGNFNTFLGFPTKFSGAFSVSADITVTTVNKASNASGIGVGMFTGFSNTDAYGFMLVRNTSTTANNYVALYSKGTSVGTSSTGQVTGIAVGTKYTVTFRRDATTVYWRAYPTGGTVAAESSAGLSNFIGSTGDVYAGISFANLNATIDNFTIRDANGVKVFDSTNGSRTSVTVANLSLSASEVDLTPAATSTVTATAVALGGATSTVSAVSANTSVATVSVSGSAVTITGVAAGSTTVTVTNDSDTSSTKSKTIAVTVNDYSTSDNYGTIPAATFYPQAGSTGAYTDGEWALTFDSTPTLNTGGSIRIHKKSDGSLVDTIKFANESQTAWGNTIAVGTQLARVSGTTVYFTPHFGKLLNDTEYYVVIPTTAITGTFNGSAFAGFSSLNTVATWSVSTRSAPTLSASNVTVDGSQASTANFRTVQGALSALDTAFGTGTVSPADITVNVAAGTYRELVHYKGGHNVTLAGPSGNTKGDSVVIQYTNGNNMNGNTHTRASFYISNSNFVLKNVTIKNTGVRATVAQAEALYFANGVGKTLAAYNCTFSSNQDTIQTSGRNWFYSCAIEGNVDFIWGTADAALFESCSLRVINDSAGSNYSIFVARTGTTGATTIGKGYVLLNSTVSVDSGITATFARDAGTGAFYDQVALINNTFTGSGTIGAGIWTVTTAPLSLGDSTYVGWKASGNSGLNLTSLTTATGTAATVASVGSEYDTRDHILNRVVTVSGTTPSGFAAASTTWDTSALASVFGAP